MLTFSDMIELMICLIMNNTPERYWMKSIWAIFAHPLATRNWERVYNEQPEFNLLFITKSQYLGKLLDKKKQLNLQFMRYLS